MEKRERGDEVDVLQTKVFTPKPTTIKVVNKSDNPLPKYATPGAAGMDIRAFIDSENFMSFNSSYNAEERSITIQPGGRAAIPTGLYFQLPDGYEMQVRPRSGLALKQGVTVCNTPGTIDADYTGELGVILINLGNEPFEVKTGDRIAQLIISKVEKFPFEEVGQLDETERGAGGFGHSGIK